MTDYQDYHWRSGPEFLSPSSQNPWHPFHSRTEFMIAKVILDARLTEEQTNTLTKAICAAIKGEDTFELSGYTEVCELWNKSASTLASVI